MAITSTAPFPHTSAYTDRRTPEMGYRSGHLEYQDGRSLRPMDGHTETIWRTLRLILMGIMEDARSRDWNADYSTPARMEFFWDPKAEQRGVVIFDSQGRMIVHVLHALLGYGGSGPGLSENIMKTLGVTEEMIKDIQESVWSEQPYKLIVSRQLHEIIEGVNAAYPTLDVEPEWSWWRVR